MKYSEFEAIFSADRTHRYLQATSNDKCKAMTLYRWNLHLAQEMFAVINCFEVALRNAIDRHMTLNFGNDWLRDAIMPGGLFDDPRMRETQRIIRKVYDKLAAEGNYTHSQLLSNMEFGIWKYMFSAPQFRATGRTLLAVFPNKPRSTPTMQYNNTFVFNELDKINMLRNRIAHHEPICFTTGIVHPDTAYVLNKYVKLQALFSWLGIDSQSLLYGLDHVHRVCGKINGLNVE